MNNKEKFENFLESLKGNGQDKLIESVKQGFRVCFEALSEGKKQEMKDYLRKMFDNPREEDLDEAIYWFTSRKDMYSEGVIEPIVDYVDALHFKYKMKVNIAS